MGNPARMFGLEIREYLEDRNVDDPRLAALFDALLEETYEA